MSRLFNDLNKIIKPKSSQSDWFVADCQSGYSCHHQDLEGCSCNQEGQADAQ